MGLKGQPKTNGGEIQERVIFPSSVPLTFTLLEVKLKLLERTYRGVTAMKTEFIMIWADADGDELVEFVPMPKVLAWNEKSKFWKRMSPLAGVEISEENIGEFDMEIEVQSFEELDALLHEVDPKTGKTQTLKVSGFTWAGTQLIGKKCQLILSEWKRADGTVGGNNIETSLPIGGEAAGKRKAGSNTQPPPALATAASTQAMP